MGRGSISKVRDKNDRIRKKKQRDKAQAQARGLARGKKTS